MKKILINILEKFGICIHNWKYVRKYFEDKFLDTEIITFFTPFRICKKCNKIQILQYDMQGSYWQDLTDIQKINILKNNLIDKGKYFELKTKKRHRKRSLKNKKRGEKRRKRKKNPFTDFDPEEHIRVVTEGMRPPNKEDYFIVKKNKKK